MTERIKQCDVVESCVDCPRYGDDCDGDKRIEPTDLISRAEVHKTLSLLATEGGTDAKMLLSDAHEFIDALPSADAVSREECDECKTDKEGVLLQQLAELQGDYETMKNAYEDALADAEWIPCSERLPNTAEQVLISVCDDNGDTPYNYTAVGWRCEKCWVSDNDYVLGNVLAWMPLPKPYKGGAK